MKAEKERENKKKWNDDMCGSRTRSSNSSSSSLSFWHMGMKMGVGSDEQRGGVWEEKEEEDEAGERRVARRGVWERQENSSINAQARDPLLRICIEDKEKGREWWIMILLSEEEVEEWWEKLKNRIETDRIDKQRRRGSRGCVKTRKEETNI